MKFIKIDDIIINVDDISYIKQETPVGCEIFFKSKSSTVSVLQSIEKIYNLITNNAGI